MNWPSPCQVRAAARQHTGRCENVEGRPGAYSRHIVRLRVVGGRELCAGCCEPYRPELTKPKRRRIPAAEGDLRPARQANSPKSNQK